MLSDWFIDGVPKGRRGSVDRRRMLVQGAFVGAFVSLCFVIQRSYLVPGFGPRHVNIILICLLLAAIPFLLKVTRRYWLTAHSMVGGLSLAIILDCGLHGSVDQPTLIAFLITPLMAAFYLDQRATAGYGVVMSVGAVILTVLFGEGMLPERVVMPQVSWLGTVVGLIFFVVVVMRTYARERDEEARKTRAIVDNLSDGLAGLSATGIIEFANAPLLELLGLSDAAIGESVEVLGPLWGGGARTALEGGVVITTTHDVGGRILTLTTSPYQGGAVVLARDVTRETEVDRMKTEFTSIVSHELRTPLAAILGFAKIIRKRLDTQIWPIITSDEPKTQKAVQTVTGNLATIVTEGDRLGSLIDDMLDIAKMESGQMRWARESIDPATLVRGAAEATQALFDGDVRLVVDAEDGLPTILGDPARLHQLLLNFISNASKFTSTGTVTVAAAVDDEHIELSVADTGPGIAENELAVVFEKFRQTEQRHVRGTGLGLAICREIATAHHGTVHVTSTVGRGSRFVARIPLQAPLSPPEPLG